MADSLDRGNDEELKEEPKLFSSLPSRAAHAADLKNSAPDTLTGLGPLAQQESAPSDSSPGSEGDSTEAPGASLEAAPGTEGDSAPSAEPEATASAESDAEPEPVDASEVEDADEAAPGNDAKADTEAVAAEAPAAEAPAAEAHAPAAGAAAANPLNADEDAEEIEDAHEIEDASELDASADSEEAALGDADDEEPTRVLVPSSLDTLAREARPSSARRMSPPSRDGRLVSDDEVDELGHVTQEAQLLNAALQKLSSGGMPTPPRPPSRTMNVPPRPPIVPSSPSSVPLSALVTQSSPFAPNPPLPPSSPLTPGGPMMPAPPSLSSGPKLPPPPVLEPPRLSALSDAPVSLPTPAKTRPSLRKLGDPPFVDAGATPGRRSSGRSMLLAGGAVFAVSALLSIGIAKLVLPAKGAVAVSVVDSENTAVANAEVLLDGQPACAPAPCKTGKLSSGKHTIAVRAPGYGIAEQEVEIESGEDTELKFVLDRSDPAGLHVRVPGDGFRIYLDGEDRGTGSVTLAGLRPRTATLRVAGNPLYAAFEQKIELVPGKTITVEPKLVPVKAVIAIEPGPGSEGASVEVVEADGSRRAVAQLPARIEVSPGERYRVRATRAGFSDYETEVAFGDSDAEKTVHIQFVAAAARPAVAPVAAAPPRPAVPAPTPRPAPAAPARPAGPAVNATAKGTLSINSIPLSNVLVDGRPVGATPRKLELSPGKHAVMFVHPTMGRKSITVEVQPGKTAVAAVKF
ncbi:MAG TPA: PEGA domain-containing protein [Polyangiaceae bacterium]|nr:PEGA domain-containing protein [Polyangiaceae bacterium]